MNRELLERTVKLLRRCAENIVNYRSSNKDIVDMFEMANSIGAELDKPEPEPVACITYCDEHRDNVLVTTGNRLDDYPIGTKFYTSPPKREPLSNDRIYKISSQLGAIEGGPVDFARAIEKAHGIS